MVAWYEVHGTAKAFPADSDREPVLSTEEPVGATRAGTSRRGRWDADRPRLRGDVDGTVPARPRDRPPSSPTPPPPASARGA
ncbi:hypothetical protein GCM10010360_35790 [Streptomyces nogalater]